MKTLLFALAAVTAFGQKVEIEFDQAVDFSKFHTFAIRGESLNSKSPSLNSELVKKRINADIVKFLEAKGLEFVVEGPSQMNVRYTMGTVREAKLEAYPAGWRGYGTRIVRVPFTEGTLVLDFRDPSTRSLVWRAIARVEKDDPQSVEKKLDDMVRKSIEKYPPKPK
jgi:hypothetical protein